MGGVHADRYEIEKPETSRESLQGADRDGMYATVLPSGTVSFRYNYRVNGRYETLVLGRYGAGGLSLQEARERLREAKKAQSEGKSPSRLKAQSRNRLATGEPFSVWAERWLVKYKMAESTRDMRRAAYERDLKRPFGNLLLHEITHNELRSVCDAILARGAPATAVHAREIVKLVFKYAEQRGQQIINPADLVAPSSIAVFEPRDRALGAEEIALFYEHIEYVQCAPTLRLACKLLLLTMVRKSELTDATWSEVDFSDALWTIPARRMKRRNPHNVYRIAIHAAVGASSGCDAYSGEPLDWTLLGTYDNADSAEGGRTYKHDFALLPTVDHVGDGLGPADFKICGWRVNDAKHDLDVPAFLAVCRAVLEHHGFTVVAPTVNPLGSEA